MNYDDEENGDFNVPKLTRSCVTDRSQENSRENPPDLFAHFELPTYYDSDIHRDEVDGQKLKDLLKTTFKKSGALHAIKANLRKEFIKGLTRGNEGDKRSIAAASAYTDHGSGDGESFNMVNRIIFSAILKFMKQRELFNSMSVFMAETGMEQEQCTLTETDMVRMFKFNAISNCFKEVHNTLSQRDRSTFTSNSGFSTSVSSGTRSNNSESCRSSMSYLIHELPISLSTTTRSLLVHNRTSLLDIIFEFCLNLNQEQFRSTESQTETNGLTTMEILDNQLNELNRQYDAQRFGSANGKNFDQQASKSIEERMIAFQRECEQRKNHEIELQMRYFRENELQKIRIEESSKCRQQIESLRKELDFDYRQRLQSHIEREQESSRRLAEQERKLQETLYDTRQMMQREIDELRSRELNHVRKVEMESQGLRLLELRLKEAQSVMESRERDITKMERDLELKRQETLTALRKEVSEQFKEDFTNLQKDKTLVAVQRQQLQDDQNHHISLLESAKSTKLELKTALDNLALKEEEIASLQRHQQRMISQWKAEEQHVAELLDSVDTELAKYSRPQQMLALIQRNSDLEVRISQLQDAARAFDLIEQQKEDIAKLQKSLQDIHQDRSIEQLKFKQEIEKLTKDLQVEKAKNAGNGHRMEELQQLVRDKESLVQSLSKQVQQQQRKEKFSTFGAGPNTGGGNQRQSQLAREMDSENRMSQLFDTLFDRLRHEVNFNMLGVPRYDPLTNSVAVHPSMPQPPLSDLAKMPLNGELPGQNLGTSLNPGYLMNYSNDTILLARRLEEEKQRKQREDIEEQMRKKKEQEELIKLKIEKEVRERYDAEAMATMKQLQLQQKELELRLDQEKKAKELAEKDLQRRLEREQEARAKEEQLLRERQEEEKRKRLEAEVALQQRITEQRERELALEKSRTQYYSGPVNISSVHSENVNDTATTPFGIFTANSMYDSLAAPKFVSSPVARLDVEVSVPQNENRRQQEQEEREEMDRLKQEQDRDRQRQESERKKLEEIRIATALAEKQKKDEEDAAEREWQEMLARKRKEDEEKQRLEEQELKLQQQKEEELHRERERLKKKAEEEEAARKLEAAAKLAREQEELAEADREAKKKEEERRRKEDEENKKRDEENKKRDEEEAEIRAARERVLARRRQKAAYDQQEEDRKSATSSVASSWQENNREDWGRSSFSNTGNTFNNTTATIRSSAASAPHANIDESSDSTDHNITKFEAGGGSDESSDDGLSAWRF